MLLFLSCCGQKMKLPLFFNREIKIFPLRHRISIFCWEIEAPRSSEATKMIRLLRNSTIILFGSSAHRHRNVSEQKCCALRNRMIRAWISFLNLCRSSWAGWGPQEQRGTWLLSLLCAHSSASSGLRAQPGGFSSPGCSFWEGTRVPPAPTAGTLGQL